MRRALTLAVIAAIVALVFYFTKPSDEYVQQQAKEHLQEHFQNAPTPVGFLELLEQNTSVKDNLIYKTAVYNRAGEEKAIGYGFLGFYMKTDLKEVF